MAKTTGTLADLIRMIPTEDAAREMLESLRWANGAVCPRCGGDRPYKLTAKATSKRPGRKGLYKCRACRKQFTVTVGTIFEDSHIPISKWLMAIHLLCASKKSMSAHQLHRMLGVTYRAAWFMAHRLRYAMKDGAMVKLEGVVEVDEAYIGGPRRRRVGRPGPNDGVKTPIIALVERGGRVRAFPLERVTSRNLQEAIWGNIKKGSHVITDDLNLYHATSLGFKHDTINHTRKEYVRGNIHTNTVEGFFGLLKRGIIGSFHHVSKGHLGRYIDEFEFRYNNRGISDGARSAALVLATEGKRLTFKQPSGASAA
jgi:transposase-like protein